MGTFRWLNNVFKMLAYAFMNFMCCRTKEAALVYQKKLCILSMLRQTLSIYLCLLLSTGLIKMLLHVNSCISKSFEVIIKICTKEWTLNGI